MVISGRSKHKLTIIIIVTIVTDERVTHQGSGGVHGSDSGVALVTDDKGCEQLPLDQRAVIQELGLPRNLPDKERQRQHGGTGWLSW